MLSIELSVDSSNGFHLRPVAKFVSVAKTFGSEITLSFKGRTCNAKAVNPILSLCLEKGDSFTLHCQGEDASKALLTLKALFDTLMQDDVEIKASKIEENIYRTPAIDTSTIYAGIVIAPLYLYKEKIVHTKTTCTFKEACQKTATKLNQKYTSSNHSNKEIYLAQKELLLASSENINSLDAFRDFIHKQSETLLGSKLASKIIDYKDILSAVENHMGIQKITQYPSTPCILYADDLLPSQIEALKETSVQAVVLKSTTVTSHTAILLASAGIPSVIAELSEVAEDTSLILDGYVAKILTQANDADIKLARQRQKAKANDASLAYEKRFDEAITTKGKKIKILANITDEKTAKLALEEGAEGVGLFRTEFLFKETKPSFALQVDSYKAVFTHFSEITVRTLDVGGDKALPYIDLEKEDNPFLGIRGIRLFKTHATIMSEQMHAIFEAAQNKAIKVMFPMVSSVEEFIETKAFCTALAKEQNIAIDNLLFGIMIEVPSTLFLLAEFDKVVDFYSVGTNDLTQYLFAIERTHKSLRTDALSPVVFRALEKIVQETSKPLSICGELAANPEAIEKLIAIGFKTLSVSLKSIPSTKEAIRNI